jgi:alkylation response protein AidB-like acyl-CoA dehydrogenase
MSRLESVIGRLSELGSMVERFADERIRPQVEELDATSGFPADLYREIAGMGLLGVTIDERLGGGGGTYSDFSEVMELLSYGYASVSDHVGLVEIVAYLLATHGRSDQQDALLRPLLAGELQPAYAITEPEAGSDAAAVRTRATRVPGGWRIDGEKIYIHNAPVADFALALMVTDPDAGHRGMSVMVVPMDAPGVSITNKSEKMGQRASPLSGIHFDGVEVPEDNLLGTEGRGFHYMMEALDIGRLGIASLSLGISRAALFAAVTQARTRTTFGRPIADNQGVLFPIADVATEYRAARALVRSVAADMDAGSRSTVASSMAKLFASEACVRHASTAVQVFGGNGFVRGFEPERLHRDARITMIYEGTSEIQRMVIGRSLMKD